MHTYNVFCFGHETTGNPAVNFLKELVVSSEFNLDINNKEWAVEFPYHGGLVSGDDMPCLFGTAITDNSFRYNHYTDEVRAAKESDYAEDYQSFLDWLLSRLQNYIEYKDTEEFGSTPTSCLRNKDYAEFHNNVNQLKEFLANNKPKFYSIEVSD